MRNISFFRKIKLFFLYKKTIKQIEEELYTQFGIRVDKATRLYTVFAIPKNLIEEPYNLSVSDWDILIQGYIKEYTNKLSKFLNSNGLNELYDFYNIEKIDNYNYLLIYGFSLFKSNKFWMNVYKYGTSLVVLALIFLLIKTFAH